MKLAVWPTVCRRLLAVKHQVVPDLLSLSEGVQKALPFQGGDVYSVPIFIILLSSHDKIDWHCCIPCINFEQRVEYKILDDVLGSCILRHNAGP